MNKWWRGGGGKKNTGGKSKGNFTGKKRTIKLGVPDVKANSAQAAALAAPSEGIDFGERDRPSDRLENRRQKGLLAAEKCGEQRNAGISKAGIHRSIIPSSDITFN